MTPEQFDIIVQERHARERATLAHKAKEYARGDRLSNFKVAAALQRCTPEKALFGMLVKHIVSLADLVNDLDNGSVKVDWFVWDEKLGDTSAYLRLLEALVRERVEITSQHDQSPKKK